MSGDHSRPRHAHVPPPEQPTEVARIEPHTRERLVPFYKNTRQRLTHLQTATVVRILLVVLVLFALVLASSVYYAVNLSSQVHNSQTQGRKDRLAAQLAIQAQVTQNKKDVQQLACIFANSEPRGSSTFLDFLAKKYGCPPYVKSSNAPSSTSSAGNASPTPSHGSTGAAGTGGAKATDQPSGVTAQGGGAGQTSQSPVQNTGGGTTSAAPSLTPTPPPTPTSSGVLDPITCQLLHLIC